MGEGIVLKYNADSMRKARGKILAWVAICFLVVSFFLGSPVYSQQLQYSPQFQSFVNQVQQIYLAPRGQTLANLANNYPTILATVIGHALRQQIVFAQQSPSGNNQFMNLQREAQAFMTQVARTTPARLQDGRPYVPEGLLYLMNKSLQGTDDSWVLQNFGVAIGMMPSVLAASPGPQPFPGPVRKPPFGEEQPPSGDTGDSINLLGVQPQQGVKDFQPLPEIKPGAPHRDLQIDDILGTWQWCDDKGGCSQLNVQRIYCDGKDQCGRLQGSGYAYAGRVVNGQGPFEHPRYAPYFYVRYKEKRTDINTLIYRGNALYRSHGGQKDPYYWTASHEFALSYGWINSARDKLMLDAMGGWQKNP
jgi:hypothetical protein